MQTLFAVLLFVIIVYLIFGVIMVYYYPLRQSPPWFKTVLAWGVIYRHHLWLLSSFFDAEKAERIQLYLHEEWDTLLETIPTWTDRQGRTLTLFLVLKTKIGKNSMEWPPFLGYLSNTKEGRPMVERLAKQLKYHPAGTDNLAIWTIPKTYHNRLPVDVGPGQIIGVYDAADHITNPSFTATGYLVLDKEDLKTLTPW